MANSDDLLSLFKGIAGNVGEAVAGVDDLLEEGERAGQYALDLVADELVVGPLLDAGLGVLSEESGPSQLERDVVVVADPVDGSTNASRGVPCYSTSLCALDADGPWVASVVNLATGVTYEAVRGEGATRDGKAIQSSDCESITDAIVAVNGYPDNHLGWQQFRALGAASLELCMVADGSFDAYLNAAADSHGSWDYLAALLVLREAGGAIEDLNHRSLISFEHSMRRTPIAACSYEMLAEVRRAVGEADG